MAKKQNNETELQTLRIELESTKAMLKETINQLQETERIMKDYVAESAKNLKALHEQNISVTSHLKDLYWEVMTLNSNSRYTMKDVLFTDNYIGESMCAIGLVKDIKFGVSKNNLPYMFVVFKKDLDVGNSVIRLFGEQCDKYKPLIKNDTRYEIQFDVRHNTMKEYGNNLFITNLAELPSN